jgi:hypothetical protein
MKRGGDVKRGSPHSERAGEATREAEPSSGLPLVRLRRGARRSPREAGYLMHYSPRVPARSLVQPSRPVTCVKR